MKVNYKLVAHMHQSCLLILLTLSLFLPSYRALSVTPFFQVTSKYIQCGSKSMVTSGFYGNSSANSAQMRSFLVPLAKTYSAYRSMVSLKGLDFDITVGGEVNVTLTVCAIYTTSLQVCVYSMLWSQMASVQTRFIVLDGPFTKMVHFYSNGIYYVQNYSSTPYDTSTPKITPFTVPTINLTGTVHAFALLTGFNATSYNSTIRAFQFSISASYTANNVFQVVATTQLVDAIALKSISYCVIGYNQGQTMNWPFPAARVTIATFSPSSPYTNTVGLLQTFNTFWGITHLNISNQPTLTYTSSMTANISITAATVATTLIYTVFMFQFKQCKPPTPYYMVYADLCYDICPGRYYQSNGMMTCENCTNYDCWKCVGNGTCTQCSNTTDYRELNTTTGRCDPMPGYYQSNASTALPCDPNCLTCLSTSTLCTSCNSTHYLTPNSTCQPCLLSYCQLCQNSTHCLTCSPGSLQNTTSSLCSAPPYNCNNINNCLNCSNITGCSQCDYGYNLTNNTQCDNVCGDGILVTIEQCDDNNTVDNDGCSSVCVVEGMCQLALVSVIKDKGSNSGTIIIKINNIQYNNTTISTDNTNIQLTTSTYSTSLITLSFTYRTHLTHTHLTLTLNHTCSTTITILSDNNAAFNYYTAQQYQIARITENIAIIVAVIAVLFIIVGMFGGRLIGLQTAAVIQIAYVSLLTLEDISPTYIGLQALGYSLGYNKLQSYDITQDIDRPYKTSELSNRFLNNYNIVGIAVVFPLVLSLIYRLASQCSDNHKQRQKLKDMSCLAAGEYTLYCFLAFSYLNYLALFIETKYTENNIIYYAGLAIGIILMIMGVIYAVVYAKAETKSKFFNEFKDKFEQNSFPQRFYLLPMAERILVPGVMVALSSQKYGNAVVIAVYVILIVVLLKSQPYLGQRKNYRPFTNYVIVIAIESIYMATAFKADPSSILALYSPFIVLGLLLICIMYSVYALVIDLRQKYCGGQAQQIRSQSKATQSRQMQQFASKLLAQNNGSLNQRYNSQSNSNQLMLAPVVVKRVPRPKQSNLMIKQQLGQIKQNHNDSQGPLDISMDNQRVNELIRQYEDDAL